MNPATESEHAIKMNSLAAYADVKEALSPYRFSLTDEKVLQSEIETAILYKTMYIPKKEVHLSKSDIIDFMIHGLGIEVKIKGSATLIYRQLERYAQHSEIKVLLLITNKAVKMPEYINGVNIFVMQLGKSWM